MKNLVISLLISSMLLISFTSCGRFSFLYNSVTGKKTEQPATVADAVDSDYVSYEEILIDNNVPDPPLLFFTEETASFAREIITEDNNTQTKKDKKSKDEDSKKSREIVEKRTFGYDDDTVKDMEIIFYLPAEKYSEKDMKEYGKEYETYSFAAVDYQAGEHSHIVTITFVDLEYPENIAKLTKSTDLVIAKNKRISMKKTSEHLTQQHFSKKV